MKLMSILVLAAASALAPVGLARAGHEWTDGTMGPPGQSYDTTMPIFPAAKRTSPKPSEPPSRSCNSRTVVTTTNPNGTRNSDQRRQSNAQSTVAVDEHETCRNLTP